MNGGLGRWRTTVRRQRYGTIGLALGVVLTAIGVMTAPASRADAAITSSGPLTNIGISSTLNCSVNHTADTRGEWFSDTACGTFVAIGGQVYGPASVPAGPSDGSPANYHAFTPVSQTGPTGTGTSADPYKIVTVVDAGSTGLRVTETDTYVVGQESYRTDVVIANSGTSTANAIAYRAGDCYLQNNDRGFGEFSGNGAVTCRAAADPAAATPVPGERIEQLLPLVGGSSRQEDNYSEIWDFVRTGVPFANECEECANYVDNGIGLSWTLAIPAGSSATVGNLTSFSPTGVQPLTTSKTADSSTSNPGGANGYTIQIHNPNTSPATLNSVTDTLPAGFTYVPGSTTGGTTANPTVNGNTLTWSGSFPVAAGQSFTLHFNVTASCTPGTYTNSAGGDAGSVAVAPASNTAPITVASTPACSTTPTTAPGTPTTTTTTAPTTTTSPPPCNIAQSAASVSPTTAKPGGNVTVSDGCFAPNATLTQVFESAPVNLGTVQADSSGRYTRTIVVPLSADPGIHRIVTTGPNPAGTQHQSTAVITVLDLQCTDFTYREDAQAVLDANRADPHGLDSDRDGRACETLRSKALNLVVTGASTQHQLLVAGLALMLGSALVIAGRRPWLVVSTAASRLNHLIDEAERRYGDRS